MSPKTATEMSRVSWPDKRRLRADALTSHIMHIIGAFITDREHDLHRCAHEALFKAFYDSGVEVITDMERARAGLMPRNDEGYTAYELQIMEARMQEAMLRPITMPFFTSDQSK